VLALQKGILLPLLRACKKKSYLLLLTLR
jgi:hypothetical protein